MEKGIRLQLGQKKEAIGSSMYNNPRPSPMPSNFVVARYKNGKIVKGSTYNFNPHRRFFHIVPREKEDEKIFEISFSELKAVFFVKSLEGKRDHPPAKADFEEDFKTRGTTTTMKITFLDGETVMGTTHAYDPEREGFFVHPLDEENNNMRIYILVNAVKYLEIKKGVEEA
ncbi:MAG: hypothetical protein V2B13_10015 [Pseudomonadota bacterium]